MTHWIMLESWEYFGENLVSWMNKMEAEGSYKTEGVTILDYTVYHPIL